MTGRQTDHRLIDALRASGASPAEIAKQRVSFVMGVLPTKSALTKDQVQKALADSADVRKRA